MSFWKKGNCRSLIFSSSFSFHVTGASGHSVERRTIVQVTSGGLPRNDENKCSPKELLECVVQQPSALLDLLLARSSSSRGPTLERSRSLRDLLPVLVELLPGTVLGVLLLATC